MSLAVELLRAASTAATGPRIGIQQTDEHLLRDFVQRRDEVAFENLVARHAGLVMGVCRRTLGNRHDAEDAFQATFLVLARKAAAVRRSKSLSSWLYKTAYRIALKARKRRAQRREQSLEDETMFANLDLDLIAADFERSMLDEALNRLPEKYRLPVILCCLEGKSREEAARQLGWQIGSLKGRLERARQMLRGRLLLRGVSLSAALVAMHVSSQASPAAVPASLVFSTAQAASQYAAGQAAVGYVSQNALTLAEGVIHTMTFSTIKTVACSSLLVGVVALAARLPAPLLAGGDEQQHVIVLESAANRNSQTVVALGPTAPLAFAAIGADGEGEGRGKRSGKPNHYGVFVSADETQNVIFVQVSEGGEGNQAKKTLDLARDVEITIDLGKSAKLADLHEGNAVQLWLSADKSSVVAIHAASRKRFGRWRGRDPGNIPKAINIQERTISYPPAEGQSEDQTFPIAKDAEVRIGRKLAKLEDLTTEHRVLITFSVDDKTIIQITQLGRGNEGE